MLRWPFFLGLALLTVFGLFWMMHYLVLPPKGERGGSDEVALLEVAPPPPDEPDDASKSPELAEAPPAPPAMPSIEVPMDVAMPVPLPPATSSELSIASAEVDLSGGAIGTQGFGGFTGGSGSGYSAGQRFSGESLVPLSTARPQIPKDAFEAGIEGWVEVVFFVTPSGRVDNIRIIGAEPKGVFEAAMIDSIRYWIYPASKRTREVQQRFEFKLDDYEYNWN